MFGKTLAQRSKERDSILCVGIDIRPEDVPRNLEYANVASWGESFIRATAEHAVVVKPNLGFYLQHGPDGLRMLKRFSEIAHEHGLLCILDAKFGDGAKSAHEYAEGILGPRAFANLDALTIESTIGNSGFNEYVNVAEDNGKGIFLVVRTSFREPASRFEDIIDQHGVPLWHEWANMVGQANLDRLTEEAELCNIGAVVGATRAEDAQMARRLMPWAPFLVPGFGTQGGTADEAVMGRQQARPGIIANSSSGISKAWQKSPDEHPLEAVAHAAKMAKEALNASLAA